MENYRIEWRHKGENEGNCEVIEAMALSVQDAIIMFERAEPFAVIISVTKKI